VSRRIPVGNGGIVRLGCWQERILQDSGISGLVKGHNVDVVSLIFLDNVLCIIVGVERVHENEGDIDIISAVEVFDLSDGEIEK
jgi:hypothetical protein